MNTKNRNNPNKSSITIVGAREHNLKNISLVIPKDTLTVITGPSGSGKSSLALDILYTEGKRRYTESLSAYARQFLGIAKKPDFDSIEGLCPAVAIEQKTVGSNPRSTVGTITEIYDYLRVLYARIGQVFCPTCNTAVGAHSPESITQMIVAEFPHTTITIAAPIARKEKGEFKNKLIVLFRKGYYRFKIDGTLHRFTDEESIRKVTIAKTYQHDIDLIIDAVTVDPEESHRLQEGIEQASGLTEGLVKITVDDKEYIYSSHRVCVNCAQSFPDLEPRFFSFNSPVGACETCAGTGEYHRYAAANTNHFLDLLKSTFSHIQETEDSQEFLKKDFSCCGTCRGKRLNKMALSVFIGGKNIYELGELSVDQLIHFCKTIHIESSLQAVSQPLFKEIIKRLTFLYDVGLSYLTLNRTARTLSGGEGQRIRLATQIGSALSGVLYILDEPSIGLHQRDNDRLIATLQNLRDQGNTVIVVEHDMDTIEAADFVVDMGPGAGVHGGQVTAMGTPEELKKNKNSMTGAYLSGARSIKIPENLRTIHAWYELKNASLHNVKNLTVKFPLYVLCGITGVSGSGKSTLVIDLLVPELYNLLEHGSIRIESKSTGKPSIISNLIVIDQSPIGRTPRSNPATYLGIFDEIRKLFASLSESKIRGYDVGRFSFNKQEGRCAECKGDGSITVSMHFLADVTMECKTCKGKRYNQEVLAIHYKQKNIAQVLAMTAREALDFFENHKNIAKRLQLLCDVGLEYLQLGQSSVTLSGGEAQRIKLVDELSKRGQDTLYILDEPTTGLHSSDIEKLLIVLNRLVNKGNSIILIEHNLDVLKTVDYIIDMGPEGGDKGGSVVAQGTPSEVAHNKASITGKYLKKALGF